MHLKRPDAPKQTLSFNKRHASFNSPREIPLPSPSAAAAMRDTPLFAADDDWDNGHKSQKGAPITPYARPYSAVEDQKPPAVLDRDRTSSASLPLPMQIPFSSLPQATNPILEREAYLRPPISSSSSQSSQQPAPPPRRRGPAPMPPPDLTTSNSGSVASYRPPRTTYTPAPPPAEELAATAIIRRSASLSSTSTYPPPDPPVIMHGDELPSLPAPALRASPDTPSTSSGSSGNRTSSGSSGARSSGASYEPFLSHAPPPVDSWIEVETTPGEYRLVVRLPGFKRDGITLATKKRRILHIVADSWDAGGGHFERRISFGYDADLAQVRAEFDGELLKVIIPRRMPAGMQGGMGGLREWGAPVGRGA